MTKNASYAEPAEKKPDMGTTEPQDTTSVPETEPCTDHLGNAHQSMLDMCDAYGIDPSRLHVDSGRNRSLEEALADPVKTQPDHCAGHLRKGCTDHTGRRFESVPAMCRAWNVSPGTYHVRIKKGMSLEEALTTNIKVREEKPKEAENDDKEHAGQCTA